MATLNMKTAQDSPDAGTVRVAVLIPCHNEERTVETVVHDFRAALPGADIYVYDNNSSDNTAARAEDAGAIVRREAQQGKGNVVKRMFSDVEADVYLLVDGDAQFDAKVAQRLVDKLITENLDMVVGTRSPMNEGEKTYRPGHQFGNAALTATVALLFGRGITDMLSGYRTVSRRFAKSFPILSHGFEIETEMTIHALQLGVPVGEVDTRYYARPEGSESKLSTYRDGFRILSLIVLLLKEVKPFAFFSSIFGLLTVASIVLTVPIFATFLETGLVPRFPTAILATGMMIVACLSLACGIVLDSVSRGRLEQKRLWYLSMGPGNNG